MSNKRPMPVWAENSIKDQIMHLCPNMINTTTTAQLNRGVMQFEDKKYPSDVYLVYINTGYVRRGTKFTEKCCSCGHAKSVRISRLYQLNDKVEVKTPGMEYQNYQRLLTPWDAYHLAWLVVRGYWARRGYSHDELYKMAATKRLEKLAH